MCSGVENPRTGHDCEACDLNHGQSRASGYPRSPAVRKEHNAPVIRDVEVAVPITGDAGRWEVWERGSTRVVEARPRRGRRRAAGHFEHVARRRRSQGAIACI